MPSVLLQILISVLIVSLISLLGILIFLRNKIMNKLLFFLVSFAAGSMLGAAFLDLLPEALEGGFNKLVPIMILIGILSFFILEKFLSWHHHHTEEKEIHAFAYMNILGDGVHNFLDGVIIAVSFMNSTSLGLVATIAIIAHEIPQEIGDFAVLIYGGFSRAKALLYNFLTALTAFAGALAAYFYSSLIQNSSSYVTAFAVGGFIYIASTDLIPEIQKEKNLAKSSLQFAFLVFGIVIIWAVAAFF